MSAFYFSLFTPLRLRDRILDIIMGFRLWMVDIEHLEYHGIGVWTLY